MIFTLIILTKTHLFLKRFADGQLECLLTCHRLSEGIDIRSIENVILFSSARARLERVINFDT